MKKDLVFTCGDDTKKLQIVNCVLKKLWNAHFYVWTFYVWTLEHITSFEKSSARAFTFFLRKHHSFILDCLAHKSTGSLRWFFTLKSAELIKHNSENIVILFKGIVHDYTKFCNENRKKKHFLFNLVISVN